MNKLKLAYETRKGKAYHGNSLELLDSLKDNSINLVMTSPPFDLLRQKSYGNLNGDAYIEWLSEFARKIKEKLTEDGSFVLDLGGAYQKGVPVRNLYNYKVLIKFVEELGFFLAEEFFWYNSSKLPSPIEWVNKRKIRAKDSVNTVWWFSKTEHPKSDVRNVLVPYSDRMQKLLKDGKKYYDPKARPSGHNISEGFNKDNGGAIPSNLLQIPNSESNSKYLKYCKTTGVKGHPARFPAKLPEFFIKFLTEPDDIVLDIFGGSNTTGEVAENLERQWIYCDLEKEFVGTSVFRFAQNEEQAKILHEKIINGEYVDLRDNTLV
ncbi:DNA-methyltransferase [Bacillus haynesii]|uniref:DNA-methyltransferase n=1 Tax=Bacillus haynesii TaxID=1925021 RepID=UPI00227EA4FF|nr:site-specific DNA-methyltransferase [Bacillus haynesii]MCY8585089.1 site-specific DNA-methyltransferase [Bacillus haynesii]MCY8681604.1 site-specific DNA-methyltransferase [Bacillus haynesii]MCY9247142.1 site-specific DNA-methyltransferase [Bacillus haynesii]MCY9321232.1 site-specific DNA-methyltransferase [Bacillus haynesii]